MTLYYLPQKVTTFLSTVGGIDASQTTGITVTSVTGVDISKPGIVCVNWSDPIDTTKYEYISYTSISGTNELVGVTRGAEGSTGRVHSSLVTVAWVYSKSHINEVNDLLTGVDSGAVLATPSITTPKITTSINDANGNEVIKTPATASAVNEFTDTNAATGGSPSRTTTGGDTNINHLLDGKGTGMVIPRMAIPQGFLINGKISVTVASNNLTVALKTIQGNNPSAADPVYVRIGDTVRTITSALSVTKNAGTNWCNAGSAELATKEIDYFVYLGYNATDGVVIGFSRIPFATAYGDFSATTTNEKYAAISTITTAASTDYYENIGRFAATLSAGAGYTWSVPTFTATNLIQRPIYETRWLTSAVTRAGITIGNGTDPLRYKLINDTFIFEYQLTLGTTSAITGNVTITLPLTLSQTFLGPTVAFTDFGTSRKPGLADQSGSTIYIYCIDTTGSYGTYATLSSTVPHTWATSDTITVSGVHRY